MNVALQINNLTAEDFTGIDRIYIGERFCVERYLSKIEEFSAYAKNSKIPAWLSAPELVTEDALDRTAKATLRVADCFEGILVADPGLGMLLRDKCRLGFKGPVFNKNSAKQIMSILGIEHFRIYPPSLEIIEELASFADIEVTAHGLIPLASTPRCLIARYRDCKECEAEYAVKGGPKPLLLRGNTVYASEPIASFGLAERFIKAGVKRVVIEGLHLSAETISKLSMIYRGDAPPPCKKSSGMYLGCGNNNAFVNSLRWKDNIFLEMPPS